MIKLNSTYRTIITLLVALLSCSTTELCAVTCDLHTESYEQTNDKHRATPEQEGEHSFVVTTPKLGLCVSSYSSQGITPLSRTLPRTLRMQTRTEITLSAVRSIDSTTSASRYGLYNHKILFYAHPRYYYLNGLVRLII